MLWNEPNNMSHWDRALDPEWALFAEMIGLAGERIGQVAPGLTRVLGGISPIDPLRAAPSSAVASSEADRRRRGARLSAGLEPLAPDANGPPRRGDPRRERRKADLGNGSWRFEPRLPSASGVGAWTPPLERLAPYVERIFWYALMDLPERWEAVTRHRGAEGTRTTATSVWASATPDGRPEASRGTTLDLGAT